MPLKLLRATQSWPEHKVIFLMLDRSYEDCSPDPSISSDKKPLPVVHFLLKSTNNYYLLIDWIIKWMMMPKWLFTIIWGIIFFTPFLALLTLSVRRSSPMDRKKTATGPDRNQKGPICKQLVATGCNRSLIIILAKNPCENTLKTTIIQVFTCVFLYR